MSFGANLSDKKYLEFFEAKSPEKLRDLLRQIKLPYRIDSLYFANGKHVAWVSLSRPITKERLTLKEGE